MVRAPISSPASIFRTLRSITIWVGSAVALALVGLCLVRANVPNELLKSSSDAVGNYLQTLGTIYAVLLAFVVFVVWQQFNDARAHIEGEANELLDLARTVHGLPETLWRPFLSHVKRYVELVLAEEWPVMAGRGNATFARGSQLLDEMWELLVEYEPCSECHKSLYDEALARFNDLSDRRMSRLVSSRLRIPLALRLLLYTGAVITAASMWLFYVESFAVHAVMTSALAGCISHVLYVISDLDDCFSGNWQVPSSQFERVGAQVEARLERAPEKGRSR
ncbi:MAG TPA: hypothetical protein VFQ35_01530 [Polyangiaceae bacterium]|nr:hypothetical protein [Polyangiaceae bacterium]